MKVGVPLSVLSPQAGGGYTFERDVAEALLREAGGSPHQFLIVTRSPDFPDGASSNVRVERFDQRRIWTWKWRWWQRSLASLGSSAGRRRLRRSSRRRGWLEAFLHQEAVDFLWNLAPGTPTHEIPYLAMVWDLQHRRQPFFPEVSRESEWEHREQFFRTLIQRATYVVTGNCVGQDEIERFYQIPTERIRLLPHPTPHFALDAPPTNPAILKSWGLDPGYLFYPAQFWPHKNHAGLLRAVRELRDRYGLRPPLVLVGADKSNLSHVQTLARELGLNDQVRLLGFVSREELVALYRHALALVYPTFFGPENLPPLEAMALGCPVIASRVAGAEQQLGEAALLVDPRQPESLAIAIARLAREPELRSRLIAAGHSRARQFTATEFVRGVFQLLDEFAAVRECWGRRAA